MGQSAFYALHDVVLEFNCEGPVREEVNGLVRELSWRAMPNPRCKPTLLLSVRLNTGQFRVPAACRETLRTDAFCGFELDDHFFLTDGSSVFHLRPDLGKAYAWIAAPFLSKPKITQANFWCFGLLKLLRPLGIYSLHAAGLATQDREGVLFVGPSGSAKSTLAIGLIQAGWNYVSDDAVLLRSGSEGVKALSCRRTFYIDAIRSENYSHLSLGDEEPDATGGWRRRVGITEAYPERYRSQCLPRVVIFTRINNRNRSALKPTEKLSALRFLLGQSAPQLFDRTTMSAHLELLKKLLQQAETYQLEAGVDLYREPAKLIDLLRATRGARIAAASH